MAYIELHEGLFTHRKLMRAAARLKAPRAALAGHLAALWCWSLTNAKEDGTLTDVLVEELAEAAGWPIERADEFVSVMVEVRFLDRVGETLRVHNWTKYTSRYYAMKASGTSAKSEGGAFGNHQRWCIKEGKPIAGCRYCVGTDSHSDSHTESVTDSLASVSLTPPPLSDLAKQSLVTNSRDERAKPASLREHRLNLTNDEWQRLADEFPGENLQKYWREWVEWVEEEEQAGRNVSPRRGNFAAFRGFVRSKVSGRAPAAASNGRH
jgi:hypothetical protein